MTQVETSTTHVLVPVAIGTAVAVAIGVYAGMHTPEGYSMFGFTSTLSTKAWLTTGAFALALVQLFSALVIYGRIRGPAWFSVVHRWSGRIAVLLTVPVVVHCLYALGFDPSSPRVLAHSLLGCFFFGAFTAKMLLLTRKGVPGWALPLIGGLVFTGLVGLWLTSSLWFFTMLE